MASNREINIAGHIYRKNPDVDRYQIHFDNLENLRMCDIPPHSHLEILELPIPSEAIEAECYGLNAGDEGEYEHLSVYGGASFKVDDNDYSRMVSRLHHAFPAMVSNSILGNPQISTTRLVDNEIIVHLYLGLDFKDKPETFVKDAVTPFVEGYQRLKKPNVHIFICHASEDKPIARKLASALMKLGSDVWLDEREIRVGDSIVQKIGDALGKVSHLIVLLSHNSIAKPWVQREFSSALMRQLSQQSIIVLPVLLDDCPIPPILADIKYANARKGIKNAVSELGTSLFFSEKI